MNRQLAVCVLFVGGCGADSGEVAPDDYCAPAEGWSTTAVEDEVTALVNQHRGAGATCGGQAMPVVPLFATDERLRCAARVHSLDMTERDYFDHVNPDGLQPWDRMELAGYPWSAAGENITQGASTASGAMQLWMQSTPHCMNIMSPLFSDLGVGYDETGANWTQVFGSPL